MDWFIRSNISGIGDSWSEGLVGEVRGFMELDSSGGVRGSLVPGLVVESGRTGALLDLPTW